MRTLIQATPQDIAPVTALALQLWPDNDPRELAVEIEALLRQEECAIFLAAENGNPIGFAQCQLRHDYVEGTDTSPVGYLEGIFVSPEWRKPDWPGCFWPPARVGQKARAVRSLPATASWRMSEVSNSIWLWDSRRQTG